ncbi:hypothetical protein BDV27DRAFT_151984 [Aspergillus caelatus]|uniref:Uncharacterized protein n=1 Tax=Aspergillus caelatus TaxID=61420 RepID=A0A5N7ALI4_9EURO|nr:uncharacterized protein BDV27DRAFT_151984 [Aspergillus caelatus]KAE8370727.1 hypothetical protein BDV27DRAFT_151984 [Aspergillus caelatus]
MKCSPLPFVAFLPGCEWEWLSIECSDVSDVNTCCTGLGNELYMSAGSTHGDPVYAWSVQGDDDGCAVVLGRDDNCWSVDNGVMSISAVSLRTGSNRRGLPTVVKANYYVYRNGSTKYRLPIGSEHAEQYTALEDPISKANFLATHGAMIETQ